MSAMHLSAVVSMIAMWLVVRSRWLHDLFSGSDSYNWLLGSIGLAAVVGMVIRILL
jgi:hypothetical protein